MHPRVNICLWVNNGLQNMLIKASNWHLFHFLMPVIMWLSNFTVRLAQKQGSEYKHRTNAVRVCLRSYHQWPQISIPRTVSPWITFRWYMTGYVIATCCHSPYHNLYWSSYDKIDKVNSVSLLCTVLIHLGRVTHICSNKLGHHCFR